MIDLRLGDCLEIMPTLPDKSFDAIIADIPYGTTACKWDTVIAFDPMWAQLKRLAKPKAAIVLFGSQPFTSALVMSNVEMFKYCWEWDKGISGNFLLAKRQPLKVHEDIICFSSNGHTYNPQMRRGVNRKKGGGKSNLWRLSKTTAISDEYYPVSIIDISGANRDVEHPTQKPVALLEYLVKTYTNEGDTVLDFTAGSGTLGVACVNTNRNAVLIEKEPEYFDIAKRRIRDAEKQLKLL